MGLVVVAVVVAAAVGAVVVACVAVGNAVVPTRHEAYCQRVVGGAVASVGVLAGGTSSQRASFCWHAVASQSHPSSYVAVADSHCCRYVACY